MKYFFIAVVWLVIFFGLLLVSKLLSAIVL